MRIISKVAFVTGGSGGIGSAIVTNFARSGYNVVINYLTQEKEAICLKEKIEQDFSVQVLLVKADVSDEFQVKKMIQNIMRKFGQIDVLVNNAGIAIDKDFENRTVEDWKQTLNVNLLGPFLVSKYVGREMINQNRGGESLTFLVLMVLIHFFQVVLIMMLQKLV